MKEAIKWNVLAFLLFSTAVLAGCGGSSGSGGSSDTTAPAVTKTTPDDGGALLPGDSVTVNFNEPINSSSVALGGDMGPEADGTVTKSAISSRVIRAQSDATGTILTIAPQTTWTTGSNRTLTVDAKDMAGNSLPTLSLAYNIVQGIVYVSTAANGGDDAHTGTKDSPMATIQAAIAKAVGKLFSPGAVAVSEGTYEVNSGLIIVGLSPYVILHEGISLYGGYSADFSQRDTETHSTTIEDVSTKVTGDFSYPNRTIEAGSTITSGTTVDGFTIQGTRTGTSDYSAAFYNNGGSPTLQNNKINGGEGTDVSSGVYNSNGAAPVIQNNAIHGGKIIDGIGQTYGIHFNQAAASVIQNNTIDAGGGGNTSAGIVIDSTGSTIIRGNIIHGGTGTDQGIGILNGSTASSIIENNTIMGGENSNISDGIWNLNAGSTTIQNNTIWGGTGYDTVGIYNRGSSPIIQNNTIDGGSGTTRSSGIDNEGDDISIHIMPSNPIIQNNIVYTSPGSGPRYCIYEIHSISNPASVDNNDLFDCPTALYMDSTDGNLTTIQEVNALMDTVAGGNVSVDPAFVDADGPDNDINTMADNDWHLSSSSPAAVTQGGLDLSADFTDDKDGKTRTVPWSMGAYER